jgi:signal peptidase I
VFDFEVALVVAGVLTGLIWLIDSMVLKRRRQAEGVTKEPTLVEYSRSFFPIIVLVLLVRSFLFEPFRIPSSSMMPTLLVGDFIFVNKYAYGLRLPVTRTKVLETSEPERGDVVVFRLPADPKTNYIKRVVGLPGDTVEYRDKRLFINGDSIELEINGLFDEESLHGAHVAYERLGEVDHEILIFPGRFGREGIFQVPEDHYFLMGDNRDNSRDSRYDGVGFIPESNLVGKAVRIWMNWNWSNSGPDWGRIGDKIT